MEDTAYLAAEAELLRWCKLFVIEDSSLKLDLLLFEEGKSIQNHAAFYWYPVGKAHPVQMMIPLGYMTIHGSFRT